MSTPYDLTLDPWPELTLDQVVAWLDEALSDFDSLFAVVAGAVEPFDTMLDFLRNIYTAVTGGVGSFIRSQFDAVYGWVNGAINAVKDAIGTNITWLMGQIGDPLRFVLDGINAISGVVSSAARWVYDNLIKPALDYGWGIVTGVGEWLWGLISGALDVLQGAVNGVSNFLSGLINGAVSWLSSTIMAAINGVSNFLGQVGGNLSNLLTSSFSWLNGFLNGLIAEVIARIAAGVATVGTNIFNTVIQGAAALGEGFMNAVEFLINTAFSPFAGVISSIAASPRKLMRGGYSNYEDIMEDLFTGNTDNSFVGFLYSCIAMAGMIQSLVTGVGSIYAQPAIQGANKIVSPALLGITDTRDAYLRGFYNEQQVDEVLARQGYHPVAAAALKSMFFEPAPPSDLIRFLVRGVFDPQERKDFALDADFPGAAVAEGRKVGLDAQTIRDYWAAHWQLPSPTQMYQMLHRGLIDGTELAAGLKAADYAPVWRPLLQAISYNVPGRIDLRRMYAAGVADEARLLKGYKELGYNDADAQLLTNFAKNQAAGATPDLPRGVILDAYRGGELTRQAAAGELGELGFDAAGVNLMLDLEDLKAARETQRLQEDAIEADLKAQLITEQAALQRLVTIGTPAARAQLLIDLWRNRHSVKPLTLSVAQVQQLLREQLLPEPVALARIQALGYNPQDAAALVALARPQAPANEPPALTLAQLFSARRQDLINDAQLQDRLLRRGYSPQDLEILLELATPDQPPPEPAQLTKAELIRAAKEKTLPVDAVQRRLAARGYSAQDVDVLLETEGFDITPTGQLVSYPRRDLTVAQLSKAFRTGLLEEKELRFRLAELSYAEEDIEILVELATPEPPAQP